MKPRICIFKLLDLHLLRGTTFSLCFGPYTLSLNLGHHLPFQRVLVLLARVLHRILGSVDLLAVRSVLVVSTEDTVPPPERSGIVVSEGHMVEVVMLGARPKWQNMLEGPWKV